MFTSIHKGHEQATEKFSRVSKVRETDRVSSYSKINNM